MRAVGDCDIVNGTVEHVGLYHACPPDYRGPSVDVHSGMDATAINMAALRRLGVLLPAHQRYGDWIDDGGASTEMLDIEVDGRPSRFAIWRKHDLWVGVSDLLTGALVLEGNGGTPDAHGLVTIRDLRPYVEARASMIEARS